MRRPKKSRRLKLSKAQRERALKEAMRVQASVKGALPSRVLRRSAQYVLRRAMLVPSPKKARKGGSITEGERVSRLVWIPGKGAVESHAQIRLPENRFRNFAEGKATERDRFVLAHEIAHGLQQGPFSELATARRIYAAGDRDVEKLMRRVYSRIMSPGEAERRAKKAVRRNKRGCAAALAHAYIEGGADATAARALLNASKDKRRAEETVRGFMRRRPWPAQAAFQHIVASGRDRKKPGPVTKELESIAGKIERMGELTTTLARLNRAAHPRTQAVTPGKGRRRRTA